MNKINFDINKSMMVVEFIGEIDNVSSPAYKDKISDYIIKHHIQVLILDFRQVTFLDSSGLGLILGRYNQMKESGGRVYITGANPYIDRIFKISGIWNIITRFNSVKEAMDIVGLKI